MTTGGTEEEADGESGPKGKERWRGSLRPKKEITHQRWERGKVAGASYAHWSRHVSTHGESVTLCTCEWIWGLRMFESYWKSGSIPRYLATRSSGDGVGSPTTYSVSTTHAMDTSASKRGEKNIRSASGRLSVTIRMKMLYSCMLFPPPGTWLHLTETSLDDDITRRERTRETRTERRILANDTRMQGFIHNNSDVVSCNDAHALHVLNIDIRIWPTVSGQNYN